MGRLNVNLSAADLSPEAIIVTVEALVVSEAVSEPAEVGCQVSLRGEISASSVHLLPRMDPTPGACVTR